MAKIADYSHEDKFLPGTKIQYAWSASSIEAIKRCPRLYYYEKIEGWSEADESVHLRFGHELHQAFSDYEIYKAEGAKHDEAQHKTIKELLTRTHEWAPVPKNSKQEKAMKYKNKDNLVRSVIWYLEKYKDDAAKPYIMHDGKPAVELDFRFELDWGPNDIEQSFTDIGAVYGNKGQPYTLYGILDKVVVLNDDLFVMDHKTTTSTPGDYYFDQFEPNTQMSLYTLASQVVFKSPVKGVIINACQVAIDFSRFTRGFTFRTSEQIEEWVYDLHYWFAKAEEFATADYWPMNDTACDKFGGCKFRRICSKSPQVRSQYLKADFVKDPKWKQQELQR